MSDTGANATLLVVKIGGATAQGTGLQMLATELAELVRAHSVVVLHGGGAELTDLSARLGIQSVFTHGVRMTSVEEMDLVDMVLAGALNKRIVRALTHAGVSAVGLSGSDGPTFTATPLQPASRTGTITGVNVSLLRLLLAQHYTPVMCSVSDDGCGGGVNINADTVALHLAPLLNAAALLFLSDIPGVLRDGVTLSTLTPAEAEQAISDGTIHGGMVPKIKAAIGGLAAGLPRVVIGSHDGPGALQRLLAGSQGTTVLTASKTRNHGEDTDAKHD